MLLIVFCNLGDVYNLHFQHYFTMETLQLRECHIRRNWIFVLLECESGDIRHGSCVLHMENESNVELRVFSIMTGFNFQLSFPQVKKVVKEILQKCVSVNRGKF